MTPTTAGRAPTGRRPVRVRVAGDLFHGRVPAGAVYVGRAAPGLPASPYANPHRVGHCRACGLVHDPDDALAAYTRHLQARPDLTTTAPGALGGRDLACWCPPEQPCHGEVLLTLANPTPHHSTPDDSPTRARTPPPPTDQP